MIILFLMFAVCFNTAVAALMGAALLIGALICRLKKPDKRKRQPSFYLKKGMIFLAFPLIVSACFGIYKGYRAIKLSSYETVLDMWRDGEGGYGKEGMRLVNDVLSAADKGDRELLVKHFSEKIKERKDFDQMIDQFLRDYPGGLSDLDIVEAPVGGPSGSGEALDDGGYITSEFRRYVISGGGRWYYLYVSFVDYTHLADEYMGINELRLQNAGARARVNSGIIGSDSDIVCEIEDYDPQSVKIIRNNAYVWYETDEPVRTRDEVYDIISRCDGDAEMIMEQLGRSNAVFEENSFMTVYYYKMQPDGDQELFLCVEKGEHTNNIYIYGNGNETIENLMASYYWEKNGIKDKYDQDNR